MCIQYPTKVIGTIVGVVNLPPFPSFFNKDNKGEFHDSFLNVPSEEKVESLLGKLDTSGSSSKPYLGNKTLSGPAIYLKLPEGIGNQLFVYACNYVLSRKYNLPLYLKE